MMQENPRPATESEERLSPADLEVLMHRRAKAHGRNGQISSIGDSTVVAVWSCRACKKPAQVTQATIDAFETFNRILRARNEIALNTGECVFCDSCEPKLREALLKRSQNVIEKTTAMVRILREGGTPDEERAAIEYIEKRFPGEGREIVAAHVAKRNKNNQPMRGV